jgi:hypothetical protein
MSSDGNSSGPPISDLIARLSDQEILRLRRFARRKMFGISARVVDADERDLLHEAIVRAVAERRSWNREEVPLVSFLMGCMRSIASEWNTKLSGRAYQRRRVSVSDELAGHEPDPEYQLMCAEHEKMCEEMLGLIREQLAGSQQAVLVYDEMRKGRSRRQIMDLLDIDHDAYDALRKRISRCADALHKRLHEENRLKWFSEPNRPPTVPTMEDSDA